jgi:predicted permease
MITNHFKIALRNLKRHKSYSVINISGLAIGISACLIIFLVVRYELSYNTFEPAYSEIYHVITEDKGPDGTEYTSGIPYPALEALRTDFPQIKVTGLYATYDAQITVGDIQHTAGKKFIEEMGVFFCEPGYFDLFSATWLAGNPSVLKDPAQVVLTEKIAVKYFGEWKQAVGKVIRIDNAMDMKVSGIIKDVPGNSDFPATVIGSFVTIKNNMFYGYTTDWGNTTSAFQVFMRLPETLSPQMVDAQLKQLADKYYKNTGAHKISNSLQPLSEIHFDKRMPGLGDHITSHSTLMTVSMIGFLIIVMACINFINLSTAQAITRSKEIGVKKVLGSSRRQLFLQTMGETNLMVSLSAVLAIVIAWLALPHIKHIVSIQEELSLFSLQNALFVVGVVIAVTLLSGFYPALILSGFKPVVALKNKISSATVGGISLRRGLVVVQFAISQILIVGTIVAVSQMEYVRTADLGFNKEALLIVSSSTDSVAQAKHAAFKQALLQLPDVSMVSLSSDIPSSENNAGTNFAFDHKDDENFTLYTKLADADYFETFGLKFAAGGPYEATDTAGSVVVNETLIRKLNLKEPQAAIGKQIRTGGGRWRTIVGVVADFKTNSLREEVKPLYIAARKSRFRMVSIKLKSTSLVRSQQAIEKVWDKFYPEYAYSSMFMDENIENFYRQEKQMALLYKIFSGLAIFISCLGLYGLVSFMTVQKTKEVGIRKVLGAGVGNILLLFSKEFTLLIGLAFVIAVPVSWYVMTNWLNNFAYKITISWVVFAVAIAFSLIIAWISVGYKALRAALANPVKSLRTE